jgi:hypothetical protein
VMFSDDVEFSDMPKLSSIELSTSFAILSPPASMSFDIEAMLVSEHEFISLRGYYMQGQFCLFGSVSVADLKLHQAIGVLMLPSTIWIWMDFSAVFGPFSVVKSMNSTMISNFPLLS